MCSLILTGVPEAECRDGAEGCECAEGQGEGCGEGELGSSPYLSRDSGLEDCSVQLYYYPSISHNS